MALETNRHFNVSRVSGMHSVFISMGGKSKLTSVDEKNSGAIDSLAGAKSKHQPQSIEAAQRHVEDQIVAGSFKDTSSSTRDTVSVLA